MYTYCHFELSRLTCANLLNNLMLYCLTSIETYVVCSGLTSAKLGTHHLNNSTINISYRFGYASQGGLT